jgi:predicted transcriptional regulator
MIAGEVSFYPLTDSHRRWGMRSLPIRLSNEIDDNLNDIAQRHGMKKTDVIRLAFALISIADKQWVKQDGSSLGIVRENGEVLEAVGQVVGVFP